MQTYVVCGNVLHGLMVGRRSSQEGCERKVSKGVADGGVQWVVDLQEGENGRR